MLMHDQTYLYGFTVIEPALCTMFWVLIIVFYRFVYLLYIHLEQLTDILNLKCNLKHCSQYLLNVVIASLGIWLLSCVVCQSLAWSHTRDSNRDSPVDIMQLLGWIEPSHGVHTHYCPSYYENTPILLLPDSLNNSKVQSVTHLRADHAVLHPKAHQAFLRGHVKLSQIDKSIRSDKAQLLRDPKTGKLIHAHFYGHVRIELPRRLITAHDLFVDLKRRTLKAWGVLYRLVKESFKSHNPNLVHGFDPWGSASQIYIDKLGFMHLKQATYSSCLPSHRTWYLSASHIILNPASQQGYAFNTLLYFHSIPILYAPFFSFPLSNKRKSGFLLPGFIYSSSHGLDVQLPVYFNLAPNTDLTLTPRYLEKRGVMFESVWRYLTETSHGQLSLFGLPHDRLFESFKHDLLSNFAGQFPDNAPVSKRLQQRRTHRLAVHFFHQQQLNPNLILNAKMNLVSDDYFLSDFGNLLNTQDPMHLDNRLSLDYFNSHWHMSALLLGYQTLHPLNEIPVEDVYRQLPQLKANGYFDLSHNLNFTIDSEYVHFEHNPDFFTGQPLVEGDRFNLYPALTVSLRNAAGFIEPRFATMATAYFLNNRPDNETDHILRVLPIVSLDSGVYFDRFFTWNHRAMQQTLEPRLFYLWIPFERQDEIPLFNTTVLPFDFGQLFRTERFVGIDRLGDANQLSLALTSRFLEADTGIEKVQASVGQIYYFHRHRVCLLDNCQDDLTVGKPVSPVVFDLTYHLNPSWYWMMGGAWDWRDRQANNGYINLLHQDSRGRSLSFAYHYVRDGEISETSPFTFSNDQEDLSRLDLGINWPLSWNWRWLASVSYSLTRRRAQNYYYGLQYNSCCWALRLIADQTLLDFLSNGSGKYLHRYYLQIRLKGLTNLGSSPLGNQLTNTLPAGYQDIFR